MTKLVIDIEKVVAITEEVEASFQFITTGLKQLKEQSYVSSNNHVPLQLLSAGFERIVKIFLVIKDKHLTGQFPKLTNAKTRFVNYDNGHGIKKMLDELLDYAETVKVMTTIPMIIDDIDFIKNNPEFREFLDIVTEFSIRQRYYYIDLILSENHAETSNPFSRFKNFIYGFEDGVDVNKQSYEEEDATRIKSAIICVEKGVRAISRFFTHGFGSLGAKYYNEFSTFIFLEDKELGSLSYTKKKVLPSESYKPLSSYSFKFINISVKVKSRIVYSNKYDDWPFSVSSVKIYSLKESCFFIGINNEIFALNGWASSRYKIPIYFKSDKLRPRANAAFLLDLAKTL